MMSLNELVVMNSEVRMDLTEPAAATIVINTHTSVSCYHPTIPPVPHTLLPSRTTRSQRCSPQIELEGAVEKVILRRN